MESHYSGSNNEAALGSRYPRGAWQSTAFLLLYPPHPRRLNPRLPPPHLSVLYPSRSFSVPCGLDGPASRSYASREASPRYNSPTDSITEVTHRDFFGILDLQRVLLGFNFSLSLVDDVNSTSETSASSSSSITPPPTSETSQLGATTHTVTAFASDTSASAAPSEVATPQRSSFLQNKAASGVVFGIVGLIGLILIVFLATFALRRRRNKKLLEDAVSFDPSKVGTVYQDMEAGPGGEKASMSTAHGSTGQEVRQAPAFADYGPPRPYMPPPSNMSPYASPVVGQHPPAPWGTSPYQNPQQYPAYPTQSQNFDQRSRRSRSSSAEIKFAPGQAHPTPSLGRYDAPSSGPLQRNQHTRLL
ncbi:unnamed protein product [Cyclocybe aegerita]|uniref:Transmembrane protein n=1 Tax=Cyclocybe aegerita TaxID=1973307 RepID=A0A8S0W2D6_CYCAE|nr:unnamed protein product [Cyclocybe aegerita]